MPGARGGVRLGPELAALADATRRSIVESRRPVLADLSEATGETADLSVLSGASMVFLDQIPGMHRLRTVSSVGEVFPLTTTANGRACLALLPEAEALWLAQAEWKRTGQPADPATFAALLAENRRTGLAGDLDEHTAGISALGIAFRDRTGELHAISVPVPTTRFVGVRPAIESALRRAAGRIDRLLSGAA